MTADTVENVTYLAAELSAAGVPPVRAAVLATDLCRIGRRYKRLREKLCGGEEEWGPWDTSVETLQDRANRKCDQLRERAEAMLRQACAGASVTGESLIISANTLIDGRTYTTALL